MRNKKSAAIIAIVALGCGLTLWASLAIRNHFLNQGSRDLSGTDPSAENSDDAASPAPGEHWSGPNPVLAPPPQTMKGEDAPIRIR